MRLLVDTHTHTVASGHAYSTLKENVEYARDTGMEAICSADHGPGIRGGAPDFIIGVLASLPESMEGVRVFCSTEANILDYDGHVDIPDRFLKLTEFAIASLHDIVIDPGTREQNTAAMAAALHNPFIDVIGHPGNPYYDIDRETVVREAKKLDKLIEINDHSFLYRKGSAPNCKDFLALCKKHGVRITVSSDAHICYRVGGFGLAEAAILEAEFPQELIVSRNLEAFNGYIRERKSRLKD
ncbi:putative phosphatase [Christensenellaceae bacterium]|nr:putative phosphatase [Christensenellaceae bacterium]BDF62202.1 putative phosphatase [Christensenellaceae bacterium]